MNQRPKNAFFWGNEWKVKVAGVVGNLPQMLNESNEWVLWVCGIKITLTILGNSLNCEPIILQIELMMFGSLSRTTFTRTVAAEIYCAAQEQDKTINMHNSEIMLIPLKLAP